MKVCAVEVCVAGRIRTYPRLRVTASCICALRQVRFLPQAVKIRAELTNAKAVVNQTIPDTCYRTRYRKQV